MKTFNAQGKITKKKNYRKIVAIATQSMNFKKRYIGFKRGCYPFFMVHPM